MSRLRALVVTVALLLVVAPLAGCGDSSGSTKLGDRLWGELIVAQKDTGTGGPHIDVPTALANNLASADYNQDGYVGTRLSFAEITFGQFSDIGDLLPDAFPGITTPPTLDLSAKRTGDAVLLTGTTNLTGLDPKADLMKLSVQFAGPVKATNGNQDASDTVSWDLTPGQSSTLSAEAHYADPVTSSFNRWAAITGAVALAAVVIVAALAWINRNPAVRR